MNTPNGIIVRLSDIAPLLVTALADPDAGVRAEAAKALEGYEDDESVEALAACMADADPAVRAAAGDTLAELKSPGCGRHLIPYLSNPSAETVMRALRALRALRVPEALDPALRLLSHEDALVRKEAAGVLGYLKHVGAVADLADAAMHDADSEVRRIAIGALGFADEDSALPALIRALKDESWMVREEAAQTIGKLRGKPATDQLISLLDDAFWQVRLKAVRSLGLLKATEAVMPIAGQLLHEVGNLRKEAVIALGEIGDPAAIPALEAAGGDPDPDVRKLSKLALTSIELNSRGQA
jgi:HEAT repeat protein